MLHNVGSNVLGMAPASAHYSNRTKDCNLFSNLTRLQFVDYTTTSGMALLNLLLSACMTAVQLQVACKQLFSVYAAPALTLILANGSVDNTYCWTMQLYYHYCYHVF